MTVSYISALKSTPGSTDGGRQPFHGNTPQYMIADPQIHPFGGPPPMPGIPQHRGYPNMGIPPPYAAMPMGYPSHGPNPFGYPMMQAPDYVLRRRRLPVNASQDMPPTFPQPPPACDVNNYIAVQKDECNSRDSQPPTSIATIQNQMVASMDQAMYSQCDEMGSRASLDVLKPSKDGTDDSSECSARNQQQDSNESRQQQEFQTETMTSEQRQQVATAIQMENELPPQTQGMRTLNSVRIYMYV